MVRTRLLVPSGTPLHDRAGEMFSPTQFGLDLLLPAFLTASRPPSLKSGDDSVKAAWALALCAPPTAASVTAKAKVRLRTSMKSPMGDYCRHDCHRPDRWYRWSRQATHPVAD